MDFSQINFLAVLVAAIATMAIGSLWYSKLLFGNVWMKINDFKEDDPPGNVARTMIITFILAIVMSFNLAAFLAGPDTDVVFGITAGFLTGFGWVALSLAVIAMFEQRSFAYIAINGGYWVVSFVAMGAILGAWR